MSVPPASVTCIIVVLAFVVTGKKRTITKPKTKFLIVNVKVDNHVHVEEIFAEGN